MGRQKKYLVDLSGQRTNKIAESVGFPHTMGSSDPGGNGIFLAGANRPPLLRRTVLVLIACLRVIPLAFPGVVPGLASMATCGTNIDNKK
jgi:hypothetical protein